MSEDLILALFVGAPLAFATALFAFHRWRRRHPRWREGAARLLLGNGLLLACLLSALLPCGEVYYRFLCDSTDSFSLTRVSREWFERHYILNEAGLRDSGPPPQPKRVPGSKRLTVLGDSFTAGQGIENVEDRFANIIRHRRPRWDVQIIAGNGWDTPQELAVLRRMLDVGWELDRVLLVYCPNDIASIVPEWRDTVQRVFAAPPPGGLVARSYFLDTLYYRLLIVREPCLAKYYDFVLEAYEGPLWEVHRRDLAGIADSVSSAGGRLLVVTFPFLHAVGPDYPYGAIHERLSAFWRKAGVPHLDLSNVFRDLDPPDLVVNSRDAHPNERAHGLAADAILTFLGE